MEPMEVIDLSSDDEKTPPKKQKPKSSHIVEKTKEEPEDEDKNVDWEDVAIVYNAVKNQKRTKDKANDICSNVKRLKLSRGKKDEENDSKIVKNLLNKSNEISLHRINRIKPETLSPRCKLPFSESRTRIDNDDKSQTKLKTNGKPDNLLNNNNNPHSKEKLKSPNTHSFGINEGASSSSSSLLSPTQIRRPHLTIKNRINLPQTQGTIPSPSEDMMGAFLTICRKQECSKDMEKIISKLRKRYNNLQPAYANSGSFIQLISHKRDLILHNRNKLYLHISEVMDEMKARQISNRSLIKDKRKRGTEESEASARTVLEDIQEEDQDTISIQDSKDHEKLKALEKAMRRCERYIIKCEEAEVNFDDENDSHYIMAEKYKYRMVELYNKYCQITGEKADAARPYLRPKHLSVTRLPSLNNAITSFINMKIIKMNKSLVDAKKRPRKIRFTDALIFPDYIDILNCVQKCNEEENLQLGKTEQQRIAKAAFSDLGTHLQRCRQEDYYETFSLYLEKADCDPALKDESLSEKLHENQELGKKKMDEILQAFVEKQYAAKPSANESGLEKENNVETDDESSEATDDEHSDMSTNDEISIGASESEEIEITDVNTELEENSHKKSIEIMEIDKPQDDLKEKTNDDIESEKPQETSNEKSIEEVELEKPQENLDQKSDENTELEEPPENPNQEVSEDLEPDKPQEDPSKEDNQNVGVIEPQEESDEKMNEDVEPDEHIDAIEEIDKREEPRDGPSSLPIEKINEKTVDMDTSELITETVVNNAEIVEEKNTEVTLVTNSSQRSPISCITVKRVRIIQKAKETAADPSGAEKTSVLLSQNQEPTSTVATCKVNLMQATKTLDVNPRDGCSPAVAANDKKVIDAPAETTGIKPIAKEEEQKPILRVRPFAKPPGSWKDFQSSSKSSIENSQTNIKADANKAADKTNDTISPTKNQANKFIRISKPIAIGKTVQVKNDLLMDLKNKSSTVMIPTNFNRSTPPRISVNTVTNNVTLNFNNQVQLQPKSNSTSISNVIRPAQNLINIGENVRITTRCGNSGVFKIGSDKEQVSSQKSNTIRLVEVNKQQISQIKRPAGQVHAVGEPPIGTVAQRQQSPKTVSRSGADQVTTIVRQVSAITDENGKRTVFRLIKHSPEGKQHRIIVPGGAISPQNQTAVSNLFTSASPKFIPKVLNNVQKISTSEDPAQSSNRVDEVYETPEEGPPIYVID